MPRYFTLSDVDVIAVSICKGPANRKRIFLKKSQEEPDFEVGYSRIFKNADWSVFYTVVAEPDWHELPGSGAGAEQGTTDVWANADEIQKASHRFMRNGGLINFQHQSLDPVGRVVENFIAPADFTVTDPLGVEQEIKKGSWVIGIEPNDDMRTAIDSGEIDGVSYEGVGMRTPVEKAKDPAKGAAYRKCPKCGGKMAMGVSKCPSCGATYVTKGNPGTLVHEPTVPPGGPGLFGMKGAQLPAYIQHVFNDLVEKGHPHDGTTYALAIGIVRNWAQGKGNVTAATKAKAVAAMAEWESLKARAHVSKALRSDPDTLKPKKETSMSLIAAIAKKLNLTDDEIAEAVAADDLTDAEREALAAVSLSKNTNEEEDVPLTDEQTAALAKVEGIEATVTELTKDDGRLAAIETSLAALLERIPAKEQSEDEKREELAKTVGSLAEQLTKAQADLEALAAGESSQKDSAETIQKTDPNAALASALFS